MRKIIKLTLLSMMLFVLSFSSIVLASGVSDESLPANIEILETNPKALFANSAYDGMQRHFLNESALKANIYTILYKNNADYKYGLVGDIQIGKWYLNSLAYENNVSLSEANFGLDKVVAVIEAYIANHADEYYHLAVNKELGNVYVKSKATSFMYNDKDKTYEGLIGASFYKSNVMYSDIIHVKIYNDALYGPSVRFVLLKDSDNKELWPKLKGLLAIK